MGLNPSHFDEYSLRELVNKLKGHQREKEDNKAILRRLAYVITAPHAGKGFKPDDIYTINDGRPKEKIKIAKIEKVGKNSTA